jgi:hypothetical protein
MTERSHRLLQQLVLLLLQLVLLALMIQAACSQPPKALPAMRPAPTLTLTLPLPLPLPSAP